jgi:DeoR/GlpR family transcriptional regulator of sugar metabolism
MLIEPGQTLYLDAGTSLFEVAKAVPPATVSI